MQWTDIPFDPPRATLRQFAGLCLFIFGGMALWEALVRGHTGLAPFWRVAGPGYRSTGIGSSRVDTLVLRGLDGPGVSDRLDDLSGAPGRVVLRAVHCRSAWYSSLIGRDPLHRARRPEVKSYWAPKPTPVDLRRYFKQF